MVHYIRFLKAPRLVANAKTSKGPLLTALITITTDLGDAFYLGDVNIHVAVTDVSKTTLLGTVCWKSGMRCLRAEIQFPLQNFTYPARFLFTSSESLKMDILQLDRLPDIVSAWTEKVYADECLAIDTDVMIRFFRMPDGQILKIYEENGESIARHIWDAGIGLAAWFVESLAKLHQTNSGELSILELGTGCGIVGLVFGNIVPNSWALLTDLDDGALKFAAINAQRSLRAQDSIRECRPLDWTEPRSFGLDRTLDFIVASDCTYNADTIPDLVRTMSDLERRVMELGTRISGPKVIVSMKVRHSSEAIFFHLMGMNGFEQVEHASVSMPDKYRQSVGEALETVDIYIFKRNNGGNTGP
ncbi:MAG: hypothetical protein Q9218_005826 [Villophora microphyllina]